MKLEILHDATLINLQLDWDSGMLIIVFATGLATTPHIRFLLNDVTCVSVPREFPWGKSVSVNEAEITNTEEKKKCRIEMQSGDNITIECGNIDVFETSEINEN